MIKYIRKHYKKRKSIIGWGFLVTGLTFFFGIVCLFIFVGLHSESLRPKESGYWAFFGQIIAVSVATFTFVCSVVWNRNRENEKDDQELYQRLELASIELFRFQGEQIELIAPLVDPLKEIPEEPARRDAFDNYICQHLNLFELAIFYVKKDILNQVIFSSWVAWFFNISQAPGFERAWKEDLRHHYINELGDIFNEGLFLTKLPLTQDERRMAFYVFTGQRLNIDMLRNWRIVKDSDEIFSEVDVHPPEVNIEWIIDNPQKVDACIELFLNHTDKSYISHSELQIGRSKNLFDWPPDRKHLEKDFLDAAKRNTPSQKHRHILAAWNHNQECVGFLIIEVNANSHLFLPTILKKKTQQSFAVLEDIVVHKQYRRKKIAYFLLDYLQLWLREQKIDRIFLESGISNCHAHALFTNLGFQSRGRVLMKTISKNDLNKKNLYSYGIEIKSVDKNISSISGGWYRKKQFDRRQITVPDVKSCIAEDFANWGENERNDDRMAIFNNNCVGAARTQIVSKEDGEKYGVVLSFVKDETYRKFLIARNLICDFENQVLSTVNEGHPVRIFVHINIADKATEIELMNYGYQEISIEMSKTLWLL